MCACTAPCAHLCAVSASGPAASGRMDCPGHCGGRPSPPAEQGPSTSNLETSPGGCSPQLVPEAWTGRPRQQGRARLPRTREELGSRCAEPGPRASESVSGPSPADGLFPAWEQGEGTCSPRGYSNPPLLSPWRASPAPPTPCANLLKTGSALGARSKEASPRQMGRAQASKALGPRPQGSRGGLTPTCPRACGAPAGAPRAGALLGAAGEQGRRMGSCGHRPGAAVGPKEDWVACLP